MKILLAIDGSEQSEAAILEVARLPWKSKPEVTVVTALTDTPNDFIPADGGVALRKVETEAAEKNFLRAQELLAPHVQSVVHVVERLHPRRLILQVAEQLDCDLIVLGARGHSAAYRALLGSTADYIANLAKCPVLIVRGKASADNVDNAKQFRVLIAYDISHEISAAYDQFCDLQWPPEDTQVQIATMFEKPKLVPEEVTYDQDLLDQAHHALDNLQQVHALGCELTKTVKETLHIGNALCSLAAHTQCNLLFIGATGKSAIARFFLGSKSRYVLHHSECSTWIAREKSWK